MADSGTVVTDLELAGSVPVLPMTRSRKVARTVSNVASPAVLALGGVLWTAASLATRAAWMWTLFEIGFSISAPFAYILWLTRSRKVSDFEIFIRSQRHRPYLFSLGVGALTLIIMRIGNAPTILFALAGASLTEMVAMFLINTRWKISAHSAAMANFVVILFFLEGPIALPLMAGVPLMIWSRVTLRRHTLMQTIAGTLLGLTIFGAALFLID